MLFVDFRQTPSRHDETHMAYRHVTEEERRYIYEWCQAALGLTVLGEDLLNDWRKGMVA